jgi:demethylmenaquinone methyltransferase/2-methoxy-6-polyprenyl-1,4-benzoquinol methylase
MFELTRSSHGQSLRRMFSGIAPRYDLMNRLMSAGQDLRWRRLAVEAAELGPGDRLLDVAAGTGDMVFIAQALAPDLDVVAADFSLEMMGAGRRRTDSVRRGANGARAAAWTGADTYALPFSNGAFDAVTSAFLLRNLTQPLAGLREQVRVLRPGGRLVMLDATPPPDNWLRPAIHLYLNRLVPLLGSLIAGRPDAYRYLPNSIAAFLRPETIARLFEEAGLEGVYHRSFMFGTAAMAVGVKPTRKG